MTVEIRPVGVTCNIKCDYCYETAMRDVTPVVRYDREKVLAAAAKLPTFFSLFGGEAMLIPFKDLEELLALSFTRFGRSGIQTNGTLITDQHIDLFEKYKTHVGISLDGDGELNDIRWAGTLKATRKATEKSMNAIRQMCERAKTVPHLLPSLIVTLHAGNLAQDKFPKFVEWCKELDALGITSMNLHVMEMDHKAGKWAMDEREYADRLIDLWELQEAGTFKNLKFQKFDEVTRLLQGDDNVVCVWRACDPWNTDAVQGVEHDGSPSHCSRTNKDGINWLPAEGSGVKGQHTTFVGHPGARHYERQLALYVSPQEHGGCKDCEFWLICQGNCPGTAETGDWRLRSSYCYLYKRLFEHGMKKLHAKGIKTLPEWENRLELERKLYQAWAEAKQTVTLGMLIHQQTQPQGQSQRGHGWLHGDHYDEVNPVHGDHTDNGKKS